MAAAGADPAALAALPALQPLIDATPPGGTLRLGAGRWRGPATISQPLTLDGAGQAQLLGDGQGHVLVVRGQGVTVQGLHIRGSGESHDRADAGVLVQGRDHRLLHNRLDDVLFGLHLQGVTGALVQGNQVRGKPLALNLRGDALRLWNSRGNQVLDNVFQRGRDLTLINSPDNQLRRNRFDDGRYGLHVIFSPRTLAQDNHFSHTGTGLVVLYSAGVRLLGNRVAHALTAGGAGIVVKESDGAELVGNELLHNAVGLKLDSPAAAAAADATAEAAADSTAPATAPTTPPTTGRRAITVRGNLFAHNITALFFYGEAGAGRFDDNRFQHNLVTAAISAPGAGAGYRFSHNTWDDYQGFDRDGDQLGDGPHELLLYADRIWLETPQATFFRNSPALELLDFLERLAPFSTPTRVLIDPRPRLPAPGRAAPARPLPATAPSPVPAPVPASAPAPAPAPAPATPGALLLH